VAIGPWVIEAIEAIEGMSVNKLELSRLINWLVEQKM
jgi:hypothetical protein